MLRLAHGTSIGVQQKRMAGSLEACCTEQFKFEIKTMTAGENVTLTCPRQTSPLYQETFYWIRLVSGNWPEFLGATFNSVDNEASKIPHIQTKQQPGEFLLYVNKAQRNDTGLYYCIKVRQLDFIFVNGTFVKIKGQEPDVTVVLQKLPSDPVYPENPETLQCSVLSGSDTKTCPADDQVYWFRSGSNHSHPRLLYLQETSEDDCEKSPVVPSTQKCFYNFSETSDDVTYYCAVAACGQILFGNGAKLHIKESWSQQVNIFICFCLAISLSFLAVLMYVIKKNNGNGSKALRTNSVASKSRQVDVYTVVIFTIMNTDNGGKKKANKETTKMYAKVAFLH
ncbi:uncharacterized protein LOC118557499 [Fundulus heteroclitus]|uniref:uncharacterized protein LOC118557499 n=1 Tax=Fundulus heteroclitus TaxID=8078 RepID=UPI00165A7CC1|nr:uncharacterized protein LOC118557499 [Fundulus heteroclitus]